MKKFDEWLAYNIFSHSSFSDSRQSDIVRDKDWTSCDVNFMYNFKRANILFSLIS